MRRIPVQKASMERKRRRWGPRLLKRRPVDMAAKMPEMAAGTNIMAMVEGARCRVWRRKE